MPEDLITEVPTHSGTKLKKKVIKMVNLHLITSATTITRLRSPRVVYRQCTYSVAGQPSYRTVRYQPFSEIGIVHKRKKKRFCGIH